MEQNYSLSQCRRTYPRYILNASVTLVKDKDIKEPSLLRDLCSEGAGIITHYSLKENEKVNIIIKVPHLFDSPVYKEAKVVWCKEIDKNLWQGGLNFSEFDKIIFTGLKRKY